MDYSLSAKEQALKEEFYAFFEEVMKNAPPMFDRGGFEAIYGTEEGNQYHRKIAREMGKKGWLAMAWPKEYGGREAPIMEQLLFNEAIGYFGAPGIDRFGVSMFGSTLLVGATEEQKMRLLPPIANGEILYCQGWSEPDAGSDLASLKTLAIKEGDSYVINGQKTWTTGGHRADAMFCLARTDPDSKRGKGLSLFHVPMDLPGITIRPLEYMDGAHVYNEVFFDNVRVPAEDLIGEEGIGWNLTRQTMNFERSNVGGFAAVKRKVRELVEYCKEKRRGGRILFDDPIVRQKLAKLMIGAEVGLTQSYRIAWAQQKNDTQSVIALASASKICATELSQLMGNFGTEILGPYGQLEECEWSPFYGSLVELYQFCKGATIYAGANEIQRNLIAWTGLGLPRLKFQKT